MIARAFPKLASALLCLAGSAFAAQESASYPIPDGMARLIVERTEEPLLYRQDALIALNGRPAGHLARGARLQIDLAPGTWRVSARARPTAEQSVLTVVLKRSETARVRVELDPVRFPPKEGIDGISNLLRESLDAPNDDRQALFRLREVVLEVPEGDR